jgi:hypothetical protein
MDKFVGGMQWPVLYVPRRVQTGVGQTAVTCDLRHCRRRLWLVPASRCAEAVVEGPYGTSTGSQTHPREPRLHDGRHVTWIGATGAVLLTTASKGWSRKVVCRSTTAAGREGRAGTKTRPKTAYGGRFDDNYQKAPQDLNRNQPPPTTSRSPKTGAWSDEIPESESMRQGQFKSPWTGQVYDRWAPEGVKQQKTDRQGGLGRARAFETPAQRDLRTAPVEKEVPDWQKYYPGTAPARLEPPKRNKKLLDRHAYRAGSFSDIFKQLVVSTMIDLKASSLAMQR